MCLCTRGGNHVNNSKLAPSQVCALANFWVASGIENVIGNAKGKSNLVCFEI
jgi:hypothetical protein